MLPASEDFQISIARSLMAGELIVLPTETVYGIAGLYGKPGVKEKIYELKNRDRGKPLQVLVGSADVLGEFNAELSEKGRALIGRFWPGPLTLVLRCGEGRCIGFRYPDHPVVRSVLNGVQGALYATSANLSGEPPVRDARQAVADFKGKVGGIITAEGRFDGEPSTVILMENGDWKILRRGALCGEMEEFLKKR